MKGKGDVVGPPGFAVDTKKRDKCLYQHTKLRSHSLQYTQIEIDGKFELA